MTEPRTRSRVGRLPLILLLSLLSLLLLWTGGMGIAFAALRDTGLPRLSLVTENRQSIDSKEEYLPCGVSLSLAGEHSFSELPCEVRGRGNDTWSYYPKKPYRLKFSEKIALFGEKKHRSWVLLALYNDTSLSKDFLAFSLAASTASGYVPSAHYVELYVNGSYRGVYLLTEQVDESSARLDLEDSFDPDELHTPFLVELDARAPEEGVEGVDWFSVEGKSYTVRYPKPEQRSSAEQFAYIQESIAAVDALCRTSGVTLAQLSERMDVDRFCDYYLVQELMGQPEINWKSVFMSQLPGEPLRMGPVWDFDWAAAGPSFGSQKNAWKDATEGFRSQDHWFALLYANSPEFRAALAQRWSLHKQGFLERIEALEVQKTELSRAAARNHIRWYSWSPIPRFSAHCDELRDWCLARWNWMDRELRA